MRSILWSALALAFVLLAHPSHADTKAPGFQLQADGLRYSPSGTLAAADGAALSDLLASGPGLAVTGTIGLRQHWCLAARASYFQSSGSGRFRFVDDVNTNGAPVGDGAGPFDIDRKLRVTAVMGLFQYRRALGSKLELALEGGAGVVSARERLIIVSATGEKASAVGVQMDPAWSAGLGLAWLAAANSDLVFSARWTGSFEETGALWTKGDSPGYLQTAIGLRYPHDTH